MEKERMDAKDVFFGKCVAWEQERHNMSSKRELFKHNMRDHQLDKHKDKLNINLTNMKLKVNNKGLLSNIQKTKLHLSKFFK